MKLLIINDEIVTAETMKKEILWENYGVSEVFLAFNANEAKKLLEKQNIDILLCDIEMPGENGIELLHWVREKKMDVECIFLTCHANFAYAQEAVKLGCMDYVLLPARYEDIGDSVWKVVNRRKQEQERKKLQRYGEKWVDEEKDSMMEAQGEKKSSEQIVRECERYILEHLESEELSVNDVAGYCHLSPIYLNRIFKKEKGISISQYMIREKMSLAAELLKDGKLAANLVALRVGYPSYPHFSATFKKYYGVSPSKYQEN